MPYKDLVPVKVWSIYRDKNGNRKLAPDWMAQMHKSVAHGFEWGGRWRTPDGMHFELKDGS